ncbi:MarR family transcriptional regulator [Paenibacillus macerans]|uniref:MarR family winged helix-turn-helix transcriptional regulator n=1 Tax=Paenibacillus macerans TaxID=44252 RepID=UPI002E1B7032|nr:MarR family transcriptional regulator [Paenibacillus macerans]MED4958109.1 MarR family transcriptional regulator [Paenibacillus macerans]
MPKEVIRISGCHAEWELLEEADWLFRKMVRRFVKERDKVEVEGIALPGLLVMQKMIREGPQRLGDLAEELDFTSGAVTGLCDKLEQKGFARRVRQTLDRRTVWLDITEQGRAMMARNRNIGAACITLLFDGFSAEELKQMAGLFQKLTGNLEHFSGTLNALAESNAGQKPSEGSKRADLGLELGREQELGQGQDRNRNRDRGQVHDHDQVWDRDWDRGQVHDHDQVRDQDWDRNQDHDQDHDHDQDQNHDQGQDQVNNRNKNQVRSRFLSY